MNDEEKCFLNQSWDVKSFDVRHKYLQICFLNDGYYMYSLRTHQRTDIFAHKDFRHNLDAAFSPKPCKYFLVSWRYSILIMAEKLSQCKIYDIYFRMQRKFCSITYFILFQIFLVWSYQVNWNHKTIALGY